MDMERELQQVADELEVLRAVELLEYHDTNWLALDPKWRNENKREVLLWAINTLRGDPSPIPEIFERTLGAKGDK